MKPLHSQESIDTSYSKLLDRDMEDEIEDEEEEDESEIDEEDADFFSNIKTQAQDGEGRQNWNTELPHSQNGSSSSGTLGLYSSFDNIIGGSFDESNSDKLYDSSPKFDDISSHLKGALAFGLPSKGSTLRIQKPYKLVGKKNKLVLFSRPRKNSSARGTNAQRSKAELLKKVEKEMERDNIEHLDENLKIAYRIVIELMGESLKTYNSIFMETIELDPAVNGDYLEVVKEPVWLPKIKEKVLGQEYKTITEVISQIRLMLENTYKYFGATHSFSRRGLRLEYILEQKLILLPTKEIRSECSLETTHGVTEKDIKEATRTKSSCITVNGEQYFSYLLYKVKGCRQAREKELKKKRWALMRQAKVSKENEVIQWDVNLMEGALGGPVRNMWELVQINQFLYLSMDILNISQVSQYEMERLLMIPEASLTLRMLMTSLVSSRIQRAKIADKPFMPYSVWAHQLANKTVHWYRVYAKESHNPDKLFDQLGIEPKFWLVCGEQNPFSKKLFHEMTLYQRVWLLKTLCDYIAHTHKSVQEAIAEQPEENMREAILGRDYLGNEYIYFPQFNGTDVRVYRRKRHKQTLFVELEKETDGKGKLFTKDQIKAFRKLIRRLTKNQEGDEDWESEQRKLKNKLPKKRGGRKSVSSPLGGSTPIEKRSRPERLRQTPRPRYDLFSLESSLDEGDEEEFPKNRRKKIRESESEEEEDRIEGVDEREKAGENKDEILKNQKTKMQKKTGKNILKHFCKTCGKSFKTKVAMFGHTAMHAKKNKKQNSEISEASKYLSVTPQQPENSEDFKKEDLDKNIKNELLANTENITTKAEGHSIENFLVKKEIKEEDAYMKSEKSDEENDKIDIDGKKKEVENCNVDHNSKINKCTNERQLAMVGSNKLKVNNSISEDCENVSTSEMGDISINSNQKDSNKEEEDLLDRESGCPGFADGSISLSSLKGVNQKLDSKEEAVSRSISPSDVGDESSIGIPTPAEPVLQSSADPDMDEFELVASSFMELRNLITKFGALPSKYARERIALEEGEKDEEEMEEDENKNEIEETVEQDTSKNTPKPKCEQKLHHALCKLLIELAPSEGKLNIFHRQMRKKIWNEYLDWSKRDASFIDPAEEAWKSDPEPEPTPSATQTPKQSSSSSSSEDSYNDDGTRKRKLRKRKVKRAPVKPPSPSLLPDVQVPSPVNEPNEDTIVVSSRGRVRKVKRMVNYDRLDFDKLAQQAEKEAEEKKEQKRKKKEEEAGRERALQEAAQSLHIPASGVRRYIISKEGEVVGYIGNDGQVHSGPMKVREQEDASEKHVRQLQPLPIKEKPQQPVESSKIPKVVVSAWNESGTLVYVRMIGNQALELMKLIDASKNDPPRQIKLQRFNQTYTFNTNSYVLTQNIPGYPDSDTSNPQFLSKLSSQNTTTPPKFSPKKETITTSAPTIQPSHAPQTIISSHGIPATSECGSLNPVALAYKGLPSTTVSSGIDTLRTPTSSTCASLSASTRLVFASPSAVPSVSPMTTSGAGGVRLPLTPAATTNNPVIVQTENGQQIQIGLTSERLAQIVQKTGQRVVAVPNDKGGYTISLISAVSQGSPAVKSITNNQLHPSGQKSVITQLLPTATSAGGGGQQQQLSLLKSRLQQPLVSSMQSQQFVPNYTLNSQVINSPSVTRQVVIQQHPTVSTPDVVSSMAPPSHQVVQIAQAPMAQQQQQVFIQQSPQKIVQVVHTAGGRQLVQMLQPGQVLVTNNNVNPSVSSIQQPAGMVVHSPQGLKQSALFQQQVLVQQSPQPTKIQVAHSGQFAQPVQYHQESTQSKPQHIIIQPQQQYIVHHQQQQQSIPTPAQSTAQTVVVKSSHHQMGDFVQQDQNITYTPEQPLTQPLSHPVVSSTSEIPGTTALETTLMQQPSETPKGGGTKQVGRIVLLQMNDGQKFYLQLPDGRLSMLTPEQLQPLISSGAIKLSS